MLDQSLIPNLYRVQPRPHPDYPADPLAYYEASTANIEFAGYKFLQRGGFVRFALPIINPHPVHAFQSYRTIPLKRITTECPEPLADQVLDLELRVACAWLIAHWWEHALGMCPCQHGAEDEDKETEFRIKVMATLLRAADPSKRIDTQHGWAKIKADPGRVAASPDVTSQRPD